MDIQNVIQKCQAPKPKISLAVQEQGEDASIQEFKKFSDQILKHMQFEGVDLLYDKKISWIKE